MNRVICETEKCTGCFACKDACPMQCISTHADSLDSLYPYIDEDICINCGICEKTCPNNIQLSFRNTQKVFAAWSNDNEVRNKSASGGIACEFYHYWIKEGGVATGVIYDRKNGCHFILIEKEEDIAATQNSKYSFSETAGIYKIVKQKLQEGIKVLFIGVPCQVAGLYGFLGKDYNNLTTVDLICHGMPPARYLQQHIELIERQKKEQVSEVSFRDPKYHTYTYTFTLKNKSGKIFYKKNVLACDNFQLGYHKSLIYRENCYTCNYARKERIADLTIGDFSGVGRLASFDYDRRNVSCILQNTNKGALLIRLLGSTISLHERPADEAFEIENQLKSPSIKHVERIKFERIYKDTKNFTKASNASLNKEKIRSVTQLIIRRIRYYIRKILVFFLLKKNV